MTTEDVRRALYHHRTRSAAIEDLILQGDAAMDQALALLNDRHECVRWAAIRVLSEIGDERAVAPLVNLLEQSRLVMDAAQALRNITGQDFGTDASAWRAWAMKSPQDRRHPAQRGGFLSDEELVRAAAINLRAEVRGTGGHYEVKVSLSEGRKQSVWVDFSGASEEGQPLVQLSTPCGPVDPDKYEAVLKLNMSIPFGSYAIAELDGKLCFALTDSYRRDTVRPADLADSIGSLARNGDSLEKMLSRQDVF